MVTDRGAPRCCSCGAPLRFGTDRQGRTTETCACGYRGYVQTRGGEVEVRETAEGNPHRGGRSEA